MSNATTGNDTSLSDLWVPDDQADGQALVPDLGQALFDAGIVNAAQLRNARSIVEKTPGKTLARTFIDMGIDQPAVQRTLARISGMTFERVDPAQLDIRAAHRLGLEFCQGNGVLPLRIAGSRLVLGVTNVDDLLVIDEVRHKLNVAIKPVVICQADIDAIAATYKQADAGEEIKVDEIIAGIEEDDVEVVETKQEEVDLERMAGESPVIRYVNYLIFNAVKEGASDIHIEPQEKRVQVRYRIDGILFEMMNPPASMLSAIISRLKVMSNLDISERRLPQDGRIRVNMHGRKLDLRLSTLPVATGEKAVLRILDNRAIQVTLDELGMSEDTLAIWKSQIERPHGIILVTGPTGSGKTTTLYASIGQMDRSKLNISTVEDPVEYHLDGINQTQTHERIGMSFAAALRALLRQDPDVIMVGEIRDRDTSQIAIQASLTGHLVLSTLHTNDAPSAVTRLINIGVEPYLIGAALNAVLAQRLVRRICAKCAKQVTPDEKVAKYLAANGHAADHVTIGAGCDACRGTGYAGRLGLYELLLLDDFLRDKIAANPSVTEFRRLCIERGMPSLRDEGFRKVIEGRTTVDEVLRVTDSGL